MMIDGTKYVEIVKTYFHYLIEDFSFDLTKVTINGNFFYDVIFKDNSKSISISYENAEDYLQIIIFLLQNGELPDYDDKSKTLHLNRLNTQVILKISRDDIISNDLYFKQFTTPTKGLERKLMKSAKDLRLCLMHFNKLDIQS